MKLSDIKVGQQVKYTSGRWGDTPGNPLWGGKRGKIAGKVLEIGIPGSNSPFIKIEWPDNNVVHAYFPTDLEPTGIESIEMRGKLMLDKAKETASKVHEHIKPYEKYIGLIALAIVVDYFLLNGKFTHKFKQLGEDLVDRIASGMDKVVNKMDFNPEPDGPAEPAADQASTDPQSNKE